MKKIKLLAVLNMVFFLGHLVPAQLTQFKILNGQTMGEVSAKYPTLFTPAGITFSIWGIIYLALTAFCIYHLVKAFRTDASQAANVAVSRLGYLFILNNLATGLWVLVWMYEQLMLSVVLMLVQLITLIAIQVKLGIYNPGQAAATRWFTHFPLSIYFAWICIATVANISAALVGWQWNGFNLSPGFWAIFMIAIATAITLFLIVNRRNPFVGLVTIWAFYGIIVKQQQLHLPVSAEIKMAAWIGLGVVAFGVFYQVYRNRQLSSGEF